MKFSRELGVPAIPHVEDEANTTNGRRTKAKAKHQGRQQLRSKGESKALHGKYPQRVKQADVDQDKTHRWLKAAGLKAETDGFIIAARDQSPQHAGTNTTSSRSLTWTQNVDCEAVSMRPLTTWSLAALNWLKLKTSTATTRQLHTTLEDLQRVWHWGEGTMVWAWTQDCHREWQRYYSVGNVPPHWQDHSS